MLQSDLKMVKVWPTYEHLFIWEIANFRKLRSGISRSYSMLYGSCLVSIVLSFRDVQNAAIRFQKG
jgi:hypothetical protein